MRMDKISHKISNPRTGFCVVPLRRLRRTKLVHQKKQTPQAKNRLLRYTVA